MTPASKQAAHVLGIDVDAITMQDALRSIVDLLESGAKGYICVADVHGIMEAQRSSELFSAYRGSLMNVPDGMPLVWVGWAQGFGHMEHVTGPDLMLEIFRRPEFFHLKHFFYGGQPGVAEELRSRLLLRFPEVRIVGTFCPPFRDLKEEELEQVARQIHMVAPDVVWVGIGCPRQELFMARQVHRFDTRLMLGVGAAFDFHTGRVRDCAPWIKRAGLQWFHRLLQDPRRLWRRYARNNPAFIWRISHQLLRDALAGTNRRVPRPLSSGAIAHLQRPAHERATKL